MAPERGGRASQARPAPWPWVEGLQAVMGELHRSRAEVRAAPKAGVGGAKWPRAHLRRLGEWAIVLGLVEDPEVTTQQVNTDLDHQGIDVGTGVVVGDLGVEVLPDPL